MQQENEAPTWNISEMFSCLCGPTKYQIRLILSVDYGQGFIFIVYNLMTSSDLICLIGSTLYLGDDMKYETEIWYLEVNYHANSVFATEFELTVKTDGIL